MTIAQETPFFPGFTEELFSTAILTDPSLMIGIKYDRDCATPLRKSFTCKSKFFNICYLSNDCISLETFTFILGLLQKKQVIYYLSLWLAQRINDYNSILTVSIVEFERSLVLKVHIVSSSRIYRVHALNAHKRSMYAHCTNQFNDLNTDRVN